MNVKGLIDVLEEHDITVEYAEADTELIIACPLCYSEDPKLYSSVSSGAWICFRCDARGGLRMLLMTVCELSPNEAIPLEVSLSTGPETPPGLTAPKPPPAGIIDLPKGIIMLGRKSHPYESSAISYLASRGIDKQLAYWLGIGFCLGGYYQHRVIIPVRTQGALRTFVARSWLPNVKDKDKVRMPAGSQAERALFGYDNIQYQHDVILVEGVFDAISLRNAGFPETIATLGAHVTDLQRNLIKQLKPRHVILLRDDDAAGQEAVIKEGKALSEAMLSVKIARLSGADPGSASAEDITAALETAVDIIQHQGTEALKEEAHA